MMYLIVSIILSNYGESAPEPKLQFTAIHNNYKAQYHYTQIYLNIGYAIDQGTDLAIAFSLFLMIFRYCFLFLSSTLSNHSSKACSASFNLSATCTDLAALVTLAACLICCNLILISLSLISFQCWKEVSLIPSDFLFSSSSFSFCSFFNLASASVFWVSSSFRFHSW